MTAHRIAAVANNPISSLTVRFRTNERMLKERPVSTAIAVTAIIFMVIVAAVMIFVAIKNLYIRLVQNHAQQTTMDFRHASQLMLHKIDAGLSPFHDVEI